MIRLWAGLRGWFDAVVLDLARQMRWSFLPPLMVYFAYGASGITSVVGTFFVKDYLDVSAVFLAGLGFWVGLPWALKMPMGHLVDLLWRWKWLLVFFGAGLIAASFAIMYGLATRVDWMPGVMPVTAWFVLASLLSPTGYVLQDAVADALSVEAVPKVDESGHPLEETTVRALHTTMQTLGRVALIGALSAVAALNITLFAGIEDLPDSAKGAVYGRIYLIGLAIPVISVSGVLLAKWQQNRQIAALIRRGQSRTEAEAHFAPEGGETKPNWAYFIGGGLFIAISITLGLSDLPYAQEMIFAGSLAIVLYLMRQLLAVLEPAKARALVGTAIIIFVFRATPLPGAGATWFTIDELDFDPQFLAVLSLITSVLTLVGMFVLRPLMANHTIVYIVVLLSLAAGLLSLPNIGLYYGIQNWTAPLTGGLVDARFIAILDTAMESPLGQVAMIPMLAWIARNAPDNLKATFFAVMASFTNLALSASSLGTKYLNQVFTVTRQVKAPDGSPQVPADYSQLGLLLIVVAVIGTVVPLIVVELVQRSRLRSND
ncbi:MFS transporter [Pseudodonghicola xiamenensis]|uniref:BT1 family protein n=1 Tax=Pseudodonghicola xiamenensis TaxID=337702 RepID=A0A8J3H548_9RHOB|nr:membrane protein [Pseudodonghicola xiamenensis]GHG80479.1 hypothetical protein GCM10010961_03650 [Pseudodonghicola xiamenensis]